MYTVATIVSNLIILNQVVVSIVLNQNALVLVAKRSAITTDAYPVVGDCVAIGNGQRQKTKILQVRDVNTILAIAGDDVVDYQVIISHAVDIDSQTVGGCLLSRHVSANIIASKRKVPAARYLDAVIKVLNHQALNGPAIS